LPLSTGARLNETKGHAEAVLGVGVVAERFAGPEAE
jgi:hypothetical protein